MSDLSALPPASSIQTATMTTEQDAIQPARGTDGQRVAEVAARLENVTPGPWFVWDGVRYAGGGRDLCIGAGPTWLANVEHRSCVRRIEHMESYAACIAEPDTDVCELADTFTAEQEATANFIARAREDVPFLVAVIAAKDKHIEEMYAGHEREKDRLNDRIDALYDGRRSDREKAARIFARLDEALRSDPEIRWAFGTAIGATLDQTAAPVKAQLEDSHGPSSDPKTETP